MQTDPRPNRRGILVGAPGYPRPGGSVSISPQNFFAISYPVAPALDCGAECGIDLGNGDTVTLGKFKLKKAFKSVTKAAVKVARVATMPVRVAAATALKSAGLKNKAYEKMLALSKREAGFAKKAGKIGTVGIVGVVPALATKVVKTTLAKKKAKAAEKARTDAEAQAEGFESAQARSDYDQQMAVNRQAQAKAKAAGYGSTAEWINAQAADAEAQANGYPSAAAWAAAQAQGTAPEAVTPEIVDSMPVYAEDYETAEPVSYTPPTPYGTAPAAAPYSYVYPQDAPQVTYAKGPQEYSYTYAEDAESALAPEGDAAEIVDFSTESGGFSEDENVALDLGLGLGAAMLTEHMGLGFWGALIGPALNVVKKNIGGASRLAKKVAGRKPAPAVEVPPNTATGRAVAKRSPFLPANLPAWAIPAGIGAVALLLLMPLGTSRALRR